MKSQLTGEGSKACMVRYGNHLMKSLSLSCSGPRIVIFVFKIDVVA